MADPGFNGTTMTFASARSPLLSANYDETAPEISTAGSTSPEDTIVAGTPAKTITFEVIGASTIAAGDTSSSCTITYNDGETKTLTKAVCTAVAVSGSHDDRITTSITLKRST